MASNFRSIRVGALAFAISLSLPTARAQDGKPVTLENLRFRFEVPPFDYTSWLPGEPNNFGGIEDSLTLGKKNKRGKWGDHAGNQKRYFICEWDWTPPAKEE